MLVTTPPPEVITDGLNHVATVPFAFNPNTWELPAETATRFHKPGGTLVGNCVILAPHTSLKHREQSLGADDLTESIPYDDIIKTGLTVIKVSEVQHELVRSWNVITIEPPLISQRQRTPRSY